MTDDKTERRWSPSSGLQRPPSGPGQLSVRAWLMGCVLKNPEFLKEFKDPVAAAQQALKVVNEILASMSNPQIPQIKEPSESEMNKWDDFIKKQNAKPKQEAPRKDRQTMPAVPRKMTPPANPKPISVTKIKPKRISVPKTDAISDAREAGNSFRRASEQMRAVRHRSETSLPPAPGKEEKRKISQSKGCYSFVFKDERED